MYLQYQSHLHNHLSKLFSSTRNNFIKTCSVFQYKQVTIWNENVSKVSEIVIPPVLLHNEIETSGFGMEMIKFLCLAGVLIEERTLDKNNIWYLAPNFRLRKMILFVNGLFFRLIQTFMKENHIVVYIIMSCV